MIFPFFLPSLYRFLLIHVTDSFLTNNTNWTPETFARNRTYDQTDSHTNYNHQNERQWSNFKQPMPPPSTNGAKRLPALISANTMYRSTFNKPQQTVNPHYTQYGEQSELANFRSIPDLYPIQNSNRPNASYTSNSSMANGHEHSSLFSTSKYGSPHQRQPTFSNSQFLSTPRLFGNSGSFYKNSSTKPISLKGNSIFSNVSKTANKHG